ncbi:hypothetical protein WCE55_02510 [Luteimonas sp. MJ293]|uniref:hypothetical protein n=1 Tax=Luteimonas sp. MJ146 TaxID=3129240 RepID=UPI0031BA294A
MIENEYDDDYDGGPLGVFKSAEDLLRERLETLSRKPLSSLSDPEVFLCVREGLRLAITIQEALNRLERNRFLDVYAALGEEAWSILARQQAYFQKNPRDSRRYEILLKRLEYGEDSRTGAYETCGKCTDGRRYPKRIYKTQESAERAALKSSERSSKNIRVYRCRYYAGWHLTKT